MNEIITDRLILRHWKRNDLAPFAKMNADPRVMECFPATLTKEESDDFAEKILEHFSKSGWGLWAVSVVGGASFIGYIGLRHVPAYYPFAPAVEIAWRLDYDHWGKGFATEGAKAVLNYGFEKIHLIEIVSFTATVNARSIHVMEKIGLHHDPKDMFDHPRIPEGHRLREHVLYRLLRSEYHSQKKQ